MMEPYPGDDKGKVDGAMLACWVLGGLWVGTVVLLGWFYVRGWTATGTDGRTEVRLAPAERDMILSEMRQLLVAVHGVVTGLSEGEPRDGLKQAEAAARSGGMAMAADVNPVVMGKLPLAFKQMGMSVHRDFDVLAGAIRAGAEPRDVLGRLSGITSRCTACHTMYRLGT